MSARPHVRDEIIVDTLDPSHPPRHGEILEVVGTDEEHHFRVRWEDGHESVFYPGTTHYTFIAHTG